MATVEKTPAIDPRLSRISRRFATPRASSATRCFCAESPIERTECGRRLVEKFGVQCTRCSVEIIQVGIAEIVSYPVKSVPIALA